MYLLLPKFTPRPQIDLSHFRRINWLSVSDRVEYCIANAAFK